jgi:hypothetical protein
MASAEGSIVEQNVFEAYSDYEPVVYSNADNCIFTANKLLGEAPFGFLLDGSNNLLKGNNLVHLTLPPVDPDNPEAGGWLYYFNVVTDNDGNILTPCNNTIKGYTGGSNTLVHDDTDNPNTPDYDGCNDISGVK